MNKLKTLQTPDRVQLAQLNDIMQQAPGRCASSPESSSEAVSTFYESYRFYPLMIPYFGLSICDW